MKKEFNTWTNVEVKQSGTYAEFQVWGRTYVFENSFLPTSIISMGEELLSSPITLKPRFGRGNFAHIKETGEWEDFTYILTEKSDEKAVIVVAAKNCELFANATVTVEFDGFMKIDLRIDSSRHTIPELERLYLDIPMTEESRLFHYWPNDIQSILPAKDIMNSGLAEDISLSFKPYVWIGNEKRGLGIFVGESDKNFQYTNECIKVSNNNIRINLLENVPENWYGRKDKWTETLKPITYTFGFHATPVKKMSTDDSAYKRLHLYGNFIREGYDVAVADLAAKNGVKQIILHEEWSLIQNYGLADNEDALKKFVNRCHNLGIKVLAYFGYEYSTLVPNWSENCDNYCNKTIHGNYTGGWQRKPHQRDFIACYGGGYANELCDRVEFAINTYGIDGIYTDGTYVPWECANEEHGCGYRDVNGGLRVTFPVLAVRETVKRLYEIVHRNGGVIDTHQSSCCVMPTLSFADTYYDGENIQQMMSDDDMTFLSLEAFRAEYMGINYGIPANFICQWSPTNGLASYDTLQSITLLHNVHTRPSTGTIDKAAEIWRIFDTYKLNEATWHPYWDNMITTTEEENAYTNAYVGDLGTVVYAVDFIGDREITLSLPENTKEIVNCLSKESYAVKNGKVKLKLEKLRANFFVAR